MTQSCTVECCNLLRPYYKNASGENPLQFEWSPILKWLRERMSRTEESDGRGDEGS